MSQTPVSPTDVSALLQAVLRSDNELDAFCQNYFPQVRTRFTQTMDRPARIELLLTTVTDHDTLLGHLREFSPNAPAWGPQRRTWPYVLLLLTLLIALIGGFLAWRMTMGRRVAASTPRPVLVRCAA